MSEAVENVEAGAAAEGADQHQDTTPSFEDRALTMGWTPKEQFKGDPEKWVDAETFVRRGEEFLPFLKANNKRLEKALERSEAKLASMEQTMQRFAEHHTKTEQRAYERAVRELREQIATSSAAGDVQGVLNATDELAELQAEAKASAKPADNTPQADPEFEAWRETAQWYGKDKPLSAAFDALCAEVYEDGYRTPKAGLKEAEKRLREQFPHKFENPNRRQPGAVEGGGAPPRKAGKTYSDLPPDAKAACDDFVKRGLLTRETYVKDYFG
jgi:hypothetical protein